VGDVLVDLHELVVGSHVEAGPLVEQRFDDLRVGVGLDGVVRLHPRQMRLERAVVLPDPVVVDDKQGSPVLARQREGSFLHFFCFLGKV